LLVNAFARKQSWEELRPQLENGVFSIDPDAKPCNSAVDNSIPGLDYAYAKEAVHIPERSHCIEPLEKRSLVDPEAGTWPYANRQEHLRVAWLRRLALTLVILLLILLSMWFRYCGTLRVVQV
jgi:hypothetical protein